VNYANSGLVPVTGCPDYSDKHLGSITRRGGQTYRYFYM